MTYVLIHGGGSTARFWDRLIPLLDQPVLAVNLPGRADRPADPATLSVEVEVASVVADVEAAGVGDPIVVVAHSSGGLVVPGVVRALADQVERIVLNAALVPRDGERGLDCMKSTHRDGLVRAVEDARSRGDVITLPGPPADPESFRNAYGGAPLDDATLAFVVDPLRCVPDTVHHYFQPVHWSTVAPVAVTYIVTERDRPVQTATQEEMIGRLPRWPEHPTHVLRMDTGHLPAVTHPEQMARLIVAVRGPRRCRS